MDAVAWLADRLAALAPGRPYSEALRHADTIRDTRLLVAVEAIVSAANFASPKCCRTVTDQGPRTKIKELPDT